jgi:hypothetical protein
MSDMPPSVFAERGHLYAMEALLTEMETTAGNLHKALGAFDPTTFNTVPFEGSWTAGQVAEHLLKSAGVTAVLHGHTAVTQRNPDEKVELLRHVFLDFDRKLNAPDFIIPSEGPHDQTQMTGALSEVWSSLLASAGTMDLTETCLDVELPVFGLLTRVEWIDFYVVHTQRHIYQLRNIAQSQRIIGLRKKA